MPDRLKSGGLLHLRRAVVLCLLWLFCPTLWCRGVPAKSDTSEAVPEPPKDTLGRGTPRGTVLGLLSAVRNGNTELAALYLNTSLRRADAEALAIELATIIDRRLPARLSEISDKPEGSLRDPFKPDEDLIGAIQTASGGLDILVERVDRARAGKVWLFSRETLASIPDVFQELSASALERVLPNFMIRTRVAEVPLYELVALFVGIPLLYLLTGLLNRILSLVAGVLRRRLNKSAPLPYPRILPPPVRLLLLAFVIRWLVSKIPLPLLAREFWPATALVITVVACMWLLMDLNGWGEGYLVGHRRSSSGSASVLRLVRRLVDGLILFSGLVFTLNHFGINLTATLAGVGVGGIAVALAAQKTLENVIAGVSLIVDQAVRVGDVLNLGDMQGTVEEVGLRSTRIRTADLNVVSLPNGQIANMRLETLSARNRFLFHPVVGLRYDTTPVQLRSFSAGVRTLLNGHASVDPSSVRVRFVRFGTSSRDVDIFAYVFAADGNKFLETQEDLLYGITDIVQKTGAAIALPSQSLELGAGKSDKLTQATDDYSEQSNADPLH